MKLILDTDFYEFICSWDPKCIYFISKKLGKLPVNFSIFLTLKFIYFKVVLIKIS